MGDRARPWLFDPDLIVVGLFGLLSIAVGAPAIVLHLQGHDVTHGPPWLWTTVYAAYIASYLATSLLTDGPRRRLTVACFLAQAVFAIASVLLIHTGLNFVNIILVFSAALSCYVLPRWATAALVVVNTVVVIITTSGLAEQAINAVFYLGVQTVSVLTVIAWIVNERSRRVLAETHIELAATAALLEHSTRSEERLRISRDLHDVAGHQLTALALELEIATHHAQGAAEEHVLRARSIAKDLLDDVRATVSQLRDDDGSLQDALQSAIGDIARPTVEVVVDDDLVVDADRRTAIVRAAQEVVTNAIRHSGGARSLRIDVSRDHAHDLLTFEANDDGWARRDFALGNGLRGLRERAEQLGGRAEFSRGEDGGFRVRMTVPAT